MRLVATQKAKIACEARLVPFFRLPYALPIPEINFDGMHSPGDGIVVMGTGFGHIAKQANRHELGAK